MTGKRIRTDSIEAKINIATNIQKNHSFPPGLKMVFGAMKYWDAITQKRAYADWNPHDLYLVAMTCNFLQQIDDNNNLLQSEGMVLLDEKGKQSLNQRVNALKILHGMVTKNLTILGLNDCDISRARRYESHAKMQQDMHSVIDGDAGMGGLLN